ncbi:MAG: uL15 family ribosomal protein [Patescibacteria group bacterium]|nr:uL15 family ribosomal protein [Patescibacteria group bacterium]
MKLNKLPKIKKGKKKRVGRGYGSGKGGHTTGRGQKGQKARSGGTAKKPRDYGKEKGFEPPTRKEPAILNVSSLNVFSDGADVNPDTLVEVGLLERIPKDGVKVLGKGVLEKSLSVEGMEVSKKAKEKIEAAGGAVKN